MRILCHSFDQRQVRAFILSHKMCFVADDLIICGRKLD